MNEQDKIHISSVYNYSFCFQSIVYEFSFSEINHSKLTLTLILMRIQILSSIDPSRSSRIFPEILFLCLCELTDYHIGPKTKEKAK